jgi:REP element-mobilizing transposase RayT
MHRKYEQRNRVFAIMAKWKNHYKDCEYHFVTGSIGGYLPLFECQEFSTAFIDTINRVRKSYKVLVTAWVIMPEHYHFLLWHSSGEQIRKFMQTVLSQSSSGILALIKGESPYKEYKWKNRKKNLLGVAKRNYLLTVFRNRANGPATYSMWKEQCRVIPMWGSRKIKAHIDYIHANPVRRGIVTDPVEYELSSYGYWFEGKDGLVGIDVVDGLSLDA